MSSLMREMGAKALKLGIPLGVQLDVTYRCNERCVHCYLDHQDHGELTTAEVFRALDQLAEAGTLFLIFSGGELLLRRDLFDILAYARRRGFDVKLKTNGIMLRVVPVRTFTPPPHTILGWEVEDIRGVEPGAGIHDPRRQVRKLRQQFPEPHHAIV